MFIDQSDLIIDNPPHRNYGIAITDIDNDGQFEAFVTGFGFPNRVYKWNGAGFSNIADETLRDRDRMAIGVAAADVDGDGLEEIYVLNTDSFGGSKRFGDRFFDSTDGEWQDLFSLRINYSLMNLTAGRSVIAVDRMGSGIYGFFVANYGGPLRLYEVDEDGKMRETAKDARINYVTGGRGAISLPILSDKMDIFVVNEHGPNFLFRNNGNGTFHEMAGRLGLSDPMQHGRGVTALDSTDNGHFDIVYGNWEGPHRLFTYDKKRGAFSNSTPPDIEVPSRIRTIIAADFDNDGYEELFFNNIGEPNRLFKRTLDEGWQMIDPGDALEPNGYGTGAAIADFDGDGLLELMIAHGESRSQPMSFYKPSSANGVAENNWLRIQPITPYGAPARGALVELTAGGRKRIRNIDAGSGYLCQMEPIAHFGLGQLDAVEQVKIRWGDGIEKVIDNPTINQVLQVQHPQTLWF